MMLISNDHHNDRENDKGTLFGLSLPRWCKQVLGPHHLLCSGPRSGPENDDDHQAYDFDGHHEDYDDDDDDVPDDLLRQWQDALRNEEPRPNH